MSSSSVQNSGLGEDEVFDIFISTCLHNQLMHLVMCADLDLYLEEPPLPRTQDLDIVNWWKYGGIN